MGIITLSRVLDGEFPSIMAKGKNGNIQLNKKFEDAFVKKVKNLLKLKLDFYELELKTIVYEMQSIDTNMIRHIKQLQEVVKNPAPIQLQQYIHLKNSFFPYSNTMRKQMLSYTSIIQSLNDDIKDSVWDNVPSEWLAWIKKNREYFDNQPELDEFMIDTIISFVRQPRVSFNGTFMNVVLTGPAGVGKTQTAKLLMKYFKKMGILARAETKLRELAPSDFIGSYAGQTAPKTRGQLFDDMEKVTFIDEAYGLAGKSSGGDGGGYGSEAVSEILIFLDKFKGMHCMILSGYAREMENFLNTNEGLRRRFPNKIHLKPLTPHKLTLILLKQLRRKGFAFSESNQDLFKHTVLALIKLDNDEPIEDLKLFPSYIGDIIVFSDFLLSSQLKYNLPMTLCDLYQTVLVYANRHRGITDLNKHMMKLFKTCVRANNHAPDTNTHGINNFFKNTFKPGLKKTSRIIHYGKTKGRIAKDRRRH